MKASTRKIDPNWANRPGRFGLVSCQKVAPASVRIESLEFELTQNQVGVLAEWIVKQRFRRGPRPGQSKATNRDRSIKRKMDSRCLRSNSSSVSSTAHFGVG